MDTDMSMQALVQMVEQLMAEGKDPRDFLSPEDFLKLMKANKGFQLRPKDVPIVHDVLSRLANSAMQECADKGLDMSTPSAQDEFTRMVGIAALNIIEQLDKMWNSLPEENREEILASEYYEEEKAKKPSWDPFYG